MVLLAVAAVAGQPSDTHVDDRSILLAGVHAIASPGIPGPLVVVGDRAFVVAAGKRGQALAPVVAAGRAGHGRFVAFGHGGFLGATTLDTPRLLANCVRWAGHKEAGEPVRVLAPARLVKVLGSEGIAALTLGKRWSDQLDSVDVICLDVNRLSDDQLNRLDTFLTNGGGVVFAGLGWGWLQVNHADTLENNPGNQLLGRYGVYWADGYLEDTGPDRFVIHDSLPASLHGLAALDTLEDTKAAAKARTQASETLMLAAGVLDITGSPLADRIDAMAERVGHSSVPTKQSPLVQGRDDLQRFLLAWEIARAKRLPADQIKASRAAASFPGMAGSDAPRVTRRITIDTRKVGWKSTGLWLEPGEVMRVTIPETLVDAGLRLRVGCHSDTIYHKHNWDRAPEISMSKPLNAARSEVAWLFGGLVYIELPVGTHLESFDVTFEGVVQAPLFVLGKTDPGTWRSTISHYPAPWAELATDKVILSVPSSSVRELDDPQALMQFWDRVLDAAADLATIPRERSRPQRYVADMQISAGYMHSGYPIMTHLDAVADMTRLDRLSKGSWGLFHELGHNHQQPSWTFAGTTEVTCNLFALYIIETLCTPPDGSLGHPAATGDVGMDAYFAAGAPFEQWKRKPFLALRSYIQLVEAFGWDPFKEVFAQYRSMPKDKKPKTDQARRDQWLIRMSRATGHNLGPFYAAWGVPMSPQAVEQVANLPLWMPEGLAERAAPKADNN